MVVSDDLFKLIKTLNQSEKRYFKIYSSNHVKGEKNDYLKLFELIEKQKVYDEKDILAQLAGESITKHFSVTKTYLYNTILKSLRSFYVGQSASSRISEAFAFIEILFEKGFYKKCHKNLRKLKQIVIKFDDLSTWKDVLLFERKLMYIYLTGNKINAYLDNFHKELAELNTLTENRDAYLVLEDQLSLLYMKNRTARSKEEEELFKKTMENPLLKDESMALTKTAKLKYYNIHGMESAFYLNTKKGIDCCYKTIEIIESDDKFIIEHLNTYITTKINLYARLGLKDRNSFLDGLKDIRQIAAQYDRHINRFLKARIFGITYSRELNHYYQENSIEEGLKLTPTIEKGIDKHGLILNSRLLIDIKINMTRLYFFNEEYEKALDWASDTLNLNFDSKLEDSIIFARLLFLLVHFELGNLTLLNYELISTKRFLIKKKHYHQFEELLLKMLKKLVKEEDEIKREPIYKKFEEDLQELLKDPYEGKISKFFDIQAWIRGKIEQIPAKKIREQLSKN